MLIDARERFVDRMAGTYMMVKAKDGKPAAESRFAHLDTDMLRTVRLKALRMQMASMTRGST